MRIAVYGAGAIGAFVGTALATSGNDVLFIGRPKLLDEIKAGGALVTRNLAGEEKSIPVDQLNYVTEPSSLKEFDPEVVLVVVKSDATREVCVEIARLLSDSKRMTTVVSLQNGATNPVVMREVLSADKFSVMGSVVGLNVAVQPKGLYVQGTNGPMVIEDIQDSRGGITAGQVAETFTKAGIKTEADVSVEFRKIVYGKLSTNLGNAVNALSGVPVFYTLEDRWYRKVMAQLYREALAVCHANGIEPKSATGIPMSFTATVLASPDPIFKFVSSRTIKVNKHAKSSMLEDVQQGRPTEVAHLQGHVIKLASEAQPPIPVPFSTVCMRLVQDWEKGDRKTPPKVEGEELWRLGVEEAKRQGVDVEGWGLLGTAAVVGGTAVLAGALIGMYRSYKR